MLQVGGPEPVGGSVIVIHSFCLWVQSDRSKEKKDNRAQKGLTSAHLPLSRNSSFGHASLWGMIRRAWLLKEKGDVDTGGQIEFLLEFATQYLCVPSSHTHDILHEAASPESLHNVQSSPSSLDLTQLLWSDNLEIKRQVIFSLTFYPKYHNKQSFVVILL